METTGWPDFIQERADRLYERMQIPAAMALYEKALGNGVNPSERILERYMCAMLLGNFDRARVEVDRHAEMARRGLLDDASRAPLWDGKPFDRKTILVKCEHGLGDTIQFIRYVPMLRRVARQVIVSAPTELHPLLRSVPGVDILVALTPESTEPAHDQKVEVMELLHAFKTTVDAIPSQTPYLRVDGALLREAQEKIETGPGLHVGLVWATSGWKRDRNIPFDELDPILSVGDVSFYSLQPGPPAQDADGRSNITSLQNPPCSIEQIAAYISCLDLVIAPDGMIAHLAGALRRNVWTLLKYDCDWRWMLERQDSPWYPSMRLFRQQCRGEWAEPIACVAKELLKQTRKHRVQTAA